MRRDSKASKKAIGIFLTAAMLLPLGASAQANVKASVKAKAQVNASTTATSSKPNTSSSTLKEKLEQKKEEVKDKIEEKRSEVQEKIREKVNQFTDKVIGRYEAALERLQNLAARIDSRIAKFEAEGTDQAKAKQLMVTAKAKIGLASTTIATIKAGTYASTTASTTVSATSTSSLKPGFDRLRLVMQKAKEDLKAAHAALVEVVKNIKPGRNKTATTTPSTGSGSSTTTATTTP